MLSEMADIAVKSAPMERVDQDSRMGRNVNGSGCRWFGNMLVVVVAVEVVAARQKCTCPTSKAPSMQTALRLLLVIEFITEKPPARSW
jgi:hypothetical protein